MLILLVLVWLYVSFLILSCLKWFWKKVRSLKIILKIGLALPPSHWPSFKAKRNAISSRKQSGFPNFNSLLLRLFPIVLWPRTSYHIHHAPAVLWLFGVLSRLTVWRQGPQFTHLCAFRCHLPSPNTQPKALHTVDAR